MSHTNSTTNYNLPQFVGTDKPAWLTDVNGAFSTIDSTIKTVSDAANTATGTATTASTNLGDITTLQTTDKTSAVNAINEVNTNLGITSGVASAAGTTATNAKNEADKIAGFVDINTYATTTAAMTNGTISFQSLSYANNTNGTLGKIYGFLRARRTNSTGDSVISFATGLRPTSAITVNGICITQNQTDAPYGISTTSVNIATDGTASISVPTALYNKDIYYIIVASLIYAEDFGDISQ